MSQCSTGLEEHVGERPERRAEGRGAGLGPGSRGGDGRLGADTCLILRPSLSVADGSNRPTGEEVIGPKEKRKDLKVPQKYVCLILFPSALWTS
ncbi:Transcription Factor P65 [Manis pentadactyla]|nr:Transcription Factor P65 [Manis pentadactyla]